MTTSFLALLLAGVLAACSESTSEDHLRQGKELLEKRRFNPAIAEFKTALKKDIGNSEARALLGEAYFRIQDYEGADKELTRALELEDIVDRSEVVPRLAQTLLQLGKYERLDKLEIDGLDEKSRSLTLAAKGLARLYQGDAVVAEEILEEALSTKEVPLYTRVVAARMAVEQQDYDKADKILGKILLQNDKYAPAWNLQGDIFAARRMPKKAHTAYSRVLEVAPATFDARLNRAMMSIYLRRFKDARGDLAQLGRMHRTAAKTHPGVRFAKGIIMMQAGNYVPARKEFEKTVEFSYAYPLSYYYMAVIDLQEGALERALGEVYKFLKLAPESVAGPKLAARIELELGGYHPAEQLLQPIVQRYPKDIEALNLLATAKLGLGKGGQGVALLTRVARLQPESPDAKTRLGAGYFATGEMELGVAMLERAAAVDPEFEQADILLVLNYLREGKTKKAIKTAQAYRDRHPASSTSFNLLGRAFFADGKLEKAAWAFNKALELDATDTAARHGLADIELELGNYKGARTLYKRVLRYNKDDLETQLKIAASYARQGNDEVMRSMLQIAIDDHPESIEPLIILIRYHVAAGQVREAEPLIEKLLLVERGQPDALATIASYQLAAGQYNRALITLEQLQTMRPNVSQYHYMASKAYAGLEDPDSSLAALGKAVELDPEHFYAKLALARLALESGRWQLYEGLLQELQATAPQNPDVMYLEVVSARQRGDNKRVAQLLWAIQQQVPSTANVLALADHRLANGDGAGTVDMLQQWVNKHPDDIEARLRLAQIHEDLGQMGKARQQYRDVIRIDHDNLAAVNNLAWALLDERPREALRLARRAHDLSPDAVAVIDTLAMALLKNGRPQEARRTLDRALEIDPDNAQLRFHDVQVLLAQGEKERAMRKLAGLVAEDVEFSDRAAADALYKWLSGDGQAALP
ncbi:MAG: PEP-CTERM system TPR-repeat protein PrsT [Halioglobus sp.]|nr:PEP-CTERM system TPR-repeat protein PrsT [Halioglobus sp.]